MTTVVDKLKIYTAGLVALVGGYLSLLELVSSPVPLRSLIFFGSLATSLALMYFTAPGKEFIEYCRAAALEVRKVVWPDKDEVVKTTGVVLVFVIIVAIFLWMVDGLLSWLLSLLAL